MKRTGFKRISYDEAIKKNRVNKKKRSKLPSLKTLQNKCDSKLTPIIKKKHPKCMLCPYMSPPRNSDTQVAHHHVHKSKSSALRYEIDNLIPLCNHCHLVLHNNESYWASIIVTIKGIDWVLELNKKKNTIVKCDRFFYENNLKRLEEIEKSY